MASFKFVIVGGGNGSGYAARAFDEKGVKPGELCIVTEEPYVAYERPAVSKGVLNTEGGARLPGFHTCVGSGGARLIPEWYESKGIEYKTNTKVTSIDYANKLVHTDGLDIAYQKLIIATGAAPIHLSIPGSDLTGIHYLRNVQDGEQLVAAMKACKESGGKAVCLGGGYIGMEVAAQLVNNQLPTTWIYPDGHILPRLFTPELADFYQQVFEEKGVTTIKHAKAVAFEGVGGHVTHVVLDNGLKVEASLVVAGIGARARLELVEGKLQTAAGGVKVNGLLQTSDPDVYAIGDVATFPLKIAGGQLVRQEHVQHCRNSAAHVVDVLYGSTAEYEYIPYFYSRFFHLAWVFYGWPEGAQVVAYGIATAKPGAYWLAGGKVVAAFLEGGSADENNAIKALAALQPPAPPPEELGALGLDFALKAAKL